MPSNQPRRARRPASGAKPAPTTAPRPGARPAVKTSGSKTTARGPQGRPSKPGNRSRSTSIVSKKQRPWGLISAAVAVVVFAVVVIGFAVYKINQPKVDAADAGYVRAEIPAAKAIDGVQYKAEPDHTHVTTTVKYNTSPPTGGNHAQIWADCTGTVYANPIADENAVHTLEHGAVWITYRPGLPAADVATLAKLVTGQNGTSMSPYPGLKTAVSIQAWNYQLFVDKASDPRIAAFIKALRLNPATTPEFGASCANAVFKANPSTPGHPTLQ